MVIAVVLLALVVFTVIVHLASPWWLTPLASNWGSIDTTIEISFWVTGIVFVAVNLFLAWVVWRYRHTNKHKAHYEPENKPLEGGLTLVTAIGVVAMLTPGLIVWANIVNVPEDAQVAEAVGQQWQWTYRFPGDDGELGSADARHVTVNNPFGLNPDDPTGQDDILVNSHRIYLPVDESVKLYLRSTDVLHNFAVPQFRIKMDLVPGTETHQWFEPSRTGTFDILCEELCGIAHYTMRGQVVVEERAAFDEWLARYPTFAETQRQPKIDLAAGEQLFASCAGCHGQDGAGNPDQNAPNLTALTPDYMARQLRYYRDGVRGTHREDTAGQQMAAIAQSVFSGESPGADQRNLLAYIDQLPDVDSPATIDGDPKRGRRVYEPCSACHGANAEGRPMLSAPQLAGQADWYLRRQLEHFSLGWRGEHPEDQYGTQMQLMTRTIKSPERLENLLAYLSSL